MVVTLFRWLTGVRFMGSVRSRPETGLLFLDFKCQGLRLREQTALPDTVANRKRLVKVLERIETEIALGGFDYQKTFGKALPDNAAQQDSDAEELTLLQTSPTSTPRFKEFSEQWYTESVVTWRRSYAITQRGTLDKYLIPFFGDKALGQITKADVLAFRAEVAKVTDRKS